jgi:hypothetical protein
MICLPGNDRRFGVGEANAQLLGSTSPSKALVGGFAYGEHRGASKSWSAVACIGDFPTAAYPVAIWAG